MKRVPYALAALLALAVATPSHATTCNLLVDARGDGRSTVVPGLESPQLDILSGDIASGATTVVVVLRLASLDPDPRMSGGIRWGVQWRIDGGVSHAVSLRRAAFSDTYAATSDVGLVSVAIDVANATITWTVPRSAYAELATPGATFGSISASTAPVVANADAAWTNGTYVDQTPSCVPAA